MLVPIIAESPCIVNINSKTNANATGTAAVSGVTAMPTNTATIGNKYMIHVAKVKVKRIILACS